MPPSSSSAGELSDDAATMTPEVPEGVIGQWRLHSPSEIHCMGYYETSLVLTVIGPSLPRRPSHAPAHQSRDGLHASGGAATLPPEGGKFELVDHKSFHGGIGGELIRRPGCPWYMREEVVMGDKRRLYGRVALPTSPAVEAQLMRMVAKVAASPTKWERLTPSANPPQSKKLACTAKKASSLPECLVHVW